VEYETPASIDAEEQVLGALLIDGERIHEVAPLLKGEDFYREKNRAVYEACLRLRDRSEAIDQISVGHELKGELAYLSHLAAECSSSVHAKHYANIIIRTAYQRKVIEAGDRISRLGYELEQPNELMAEAMKLLIDMKPPGKRVVITPRERAERAEQTILRRRKGEAENIPFGFLDLDRETGGMGKGDLVLVGARTEMGKSTLLQQVMGQCAAKGNNVLLCSAEMSDSQYTDRDLVARTGVPIWKLAKGILEDSEWDKVLEATGRIAETPLYFLGSGHLTTADIYSHAKALQMQIGLDLIGVDYIQLLADSKGTSLREQISYVSRSLKQIARDLEVPVLAASQLNRELEHREDKHPRLVDLRESGSLEQDADMVLLLYRADAYYDEEDWEDTRQAKKGKRFEGGVLEIGIAKHRQWGSGNRVVKLAWDKDRRQYRDIYKG